jgi:hypothetical protein
VEDPVEINRRIERLVKRVRRRDDYGRLLAAGEVMQPVERIDDADAWRAAIKRQARADRIKVRTGRTGDKLWAFLEGPATEAQLEEEERYFRLLDDLKSRAGLHGHALKVALRDGEEALFRCERCDGVGYADAASGPLIGGVLFEEDCPDEELPDVSGAG